MAKEVDSIALMVCRSIFNQLKKKEVRVTMHCYIIIHKSLSNRAERVLQIKGTILNVLHTSALL